MAIDTSGDLFVADSVDSVIRKITLDGTITTVAGTGTPGFSRDNGPATSAQLNGPTGVAVDGSGNLYIADQVNQRIRKVTPGGVITTIAGTGVSGYSGYNGVAIAAELANPSAVAADNAGNVYIADTSNQLIRVVAPGGSISNIAGQWGISGPIGTGPALSEYLLAPIGLFADTAGNVYVSDMNNHSIRALTPNAGPAVLTISSTHTGSFPIGSIGQYTLTV